MDFADLVAELLSGSGSDGSRVLQTGTLVEEDDRREEFVDRWPVKARSVLCGGDELGYSVY